MKDSTALPAPDALASAVRKARWRLLPIFVVMFIVNYVDRVNVSFIKPQLEASLGIGATAYGLGAGLFGLLRLLAGGSLDAAHLDDAQRGVLRRIEAILGRELRDALGAGQHVAVLVEGAGLGLEAAVDAHGIPD